MPSHRLILEKNRKLGEWLLEWDATNLRLFHPTDGLVLDAPVQQAHLLFDFYELDSNGQVSFNLPDGELKFKWNKDAARDVQLLVQQGLAGDAGYRELFKRRARLMIPLGMVAFIVCGGLFGLYCWWASWAPDPPPGNWIYSVGWLIHLILLVLMGLGLGCPYTSYVFWRKLR